MRDEMTSPMVLRLLNGSTCWVTLLSPSKLIVVRLPSESTTSVVLPTASYPVVVTKARLSSTVTCLFSASNA
jgi:hypothetical protein